jgi:aspartate/methionine/tyrosine aminotransferase
LAESLRIKTRYYTLRAENGFRIDPDEIRKAVDGNTRLLLVNSPHNPTGAVLGDEDMRRLHDFCLERGVQFVSDEVYHPIYHDTKAQSAARLPHATVIGDFSKALCLSGLRVGWIVEHDAARREQYLNARNYFTICNNVLGERLAVHALRHSHKVYARAQHVATQNLARLDRIFAEHADTLRWLRPGGGMTVFPWLVNGSDTREFCRRLAKRGILIVPGDCFGEPSHVRIGFAATGERFPLAMERFSQFLRTESDQARGAAAGITLGKQL